MSTAVREPRLRQKPSLRIALDVRGLIAGIAFASRMKFGEARHQVPFQQPFMPLGPLMSLNDLAQMLRPPVWEQAPDRACRPCS